MDRLRMLVATHNEGKFHEIAMLLEGHGLELLSTSQFPIPEPLESGHTFSENAAIKALSAARYSQLPSIADDCGIEIDSLGGIPGVLSKRFAEDCGSWEGAMETLTSRLKGRHSMAKFCCGLAVAWPDGEYVSVTARVKGEFVAPRGIMGSGYDPCFLPEDGLLTYGEMTSSHRNRHNHRAEAFSKLSPLVDWENLRMGEKSLGC